MLVMQHLAFRAAAVPPTNLPKPATRKALITQTAPPPTNRHPATHFPPPPPPPPRLFSLSLLFLIYRSKLHIITEAGMLTKCNTII